MLTVEWMTMSASLLVQGSLSTVTGFSDVCKSRAGVLMQSSCLIGAFTRILAWRKLVLMWRAQVFFVLAEVFRPLDVQV